MPFISVVVPVYKVEDYLLRCLDSIFAQSYTDFELILVDDGSPDKCPAMCDEIAAKHQNVHVIHQKNAGLSAARNAGIEWALQNSDSEWITFIDSDDWIHPDYLSALLNANMKNHTQVSMGQVYVTEEYQILPIKDVSSLTKSEKTEVAFTDEALDPNSSCARLFKKSLFKDIRFPVGKFHEDRFTTYKVLFQFEKVSVVSAPLYYYFVNNEGIVHSAWSVNRLDNIEAIEQQIRYFSENNREMYLYHINEYIHLLVINLRQLKGQKQFSEHEKNIRKKLRLALTQYEKTLNLSFKNDFNTYKYAYPLKAKIYRKFKLI